MNSEAFSYGALYSPIVSTQTCTRSRTTWTQHRGLPCLMFWAQVRPRLAPSRSRSERRSSPTQVVRGVMRPYRLPSMMLMGQARTSRTTSHTMLQKQEPQLAILVWGREERG